MLSDGVTDTSVTLTEVWIPDEGQFNTVSAFEDINRRVGLEYFNLSKEVEPGYEFVRFVASPSNPFACCTSSPTSERARALSVIRAQDPGACVIHYVRSLRTVRNLLPPPPLSISEFSLILSNTLIISSHYILSLAVR